MKRKIIKISFFVLAVLLLSVFVLPAMTHAQAGNLLWGGQESNIQADIGLGNTDPRVMAANIIRVVLGFLGVIAVLLIIYAGWLWMTAGGEPEKIDKAKKTLIAAVLGVIIILSSFAIATFILNRMLAATSSNGGGGGGASCTAVNVGVCSGCTRCVAVGTGFSWTLDNLCPGCGAGSGPISCDGNVLPGCQADDTICDASHPTGTYFCDVLAACTCQPLGNVGDPCDSDILTPICDADDTMCMADLHCDDTAGPTLCTCVGAPVIDWISPMDSADNPNGAPGNFVTIGGRYFGTTPGNVYFTSGTGIDEIARFPNVVNSACTDFWTPNQIIVEVPFGGVAIDGQVRVERADGEIDDTGDTRGPAVNDFDINTTVRPGLCQLSTTTGIMNEEVGYVGINLAGTEAFFGGRINNVQATNQVVFADNLGIPLPGPIWPNIDLVPNIATGRTTTFASSSAGEFSNFLRFYKKREPLALPQITSFEPQAGAPGQYVTIYGSGFGRTRGASRHVYFGPVNLLNEAKYNFPQICKTSTWSDNMVIVKVPGPTPGNAFYNITMELPTGVIDTTGLLPFSQFNIDDTLDLAPSLCNITPTMGPNNSKVSLWGEYFGTHNPAGLPLPISIVRFHLNNDQFGPLAPGGPIISWAPSGGADNIVAMVHNSAVSGPVRIENNALEGNGMNFRVGECGDDADCGVSGICCPLGTFQEGRCAADALALGGNNDGSVTIEDCYIDIPSSVYEWDFSTKLATTSPLGGPCYDPGNPGICNPINPPCGVGVCDPVSCTCQLPGLGSCSGYNLLQCVDTLFCPNSPGNCSADVGGATTSVNVACDDSVCNGLGACTTPVCTYDSNLDKCVDLSQGAVPDCSLASSTLTTDINGHTLTATCALYGGQGRWHINTNVSCPTSTPGWMSIPGNRCVNTSLTCNICEVGFTCFDDKDFDYQGICAVNYDICPSGSDCDPNTKECVRTDTPSCDCCCEIGQDARDCCSPLTCEGTCGSDIIDDGSGFGECSGCWIDTDNSATPSALDQPASDLACNCSGTAGKYCDIYDPAHPSGVCRDCAGLTNSENCTDHSATCCVDAENSNNCSGGVGDQDIILFDTPNLGYCSYYDCDIVVPTTCDITASTTGTYRATSTCVTECGASFGSPGSSCFDTTTNNCSLLCSIGYDCRGLTGCTGTPPAPPPACAAGDGSCRCCCDPNAAIDSCDSINTSLFCQPDTAPCTTANRGMCCGCDQDSDCSPTGVDPINEGCSTDTCCRERPNVLSTVPPNTIVDTINVCRNAKIEVEFDMPMDITSFSGEVIVLGDYGSDVCPAGTTFLASETYQRKNNNIFVRALNKISILMKKTISIILPPRFANAYAPPSATSNYCAIVGGVSGYHNVAGHGVLEFSPNNLLDGNRKYYVLIKGDQDLLDSSNSGVLNNYGVGMNGPADNTPLYTFNGLTYNNSYIWSFTTLREQSANNGVCLLDHIDIEPSSYLFKTITNDVNENDINPLDPTFDKTKDSDKVFTAYPLSSEGQIINPVVEYDWSWGWTSDNSLVVYPVKPNILTDDKSLIRASATTTEGKAVVEALATITVDTVNAISTVGTSVAGTADVYVFLCDNPWPEEDLITGTWIPWRDENYSAITDCLPGSGNCYNTNYEFYYCRDEGKFGTFDDLPAILQDSAIIRGESADILKEVFFLREESSSATTSLVALNEGSGGTLTVTWNTVGDPLVTAYNLYWGTSPGRYIDMAEVKTTGIDDHDDVGCVLGAGNIICNVKNLVNGKTYYFNLTSIYDTGSESEFMGQVEVVPSDINPPAVPTGLIATTTGSGLVKISWNPVIDADSYIINYGTTSTNPGSSQNIGDITSVEISALTSGKMYYFSVQSVDTSNNISGFSLEITEVPI